MIDKEEFSLHFIHLFAQNYNKHIDYIQSFFGVRKFNEHWNFCEKLLPSRNFYAFKHKTSSAYVYNACDYQIWTNRINNFQKNIPFLGFVYCFWWVCGFCFLECYFRSIFVIMPTKMSNDFVFFLIVCDEIKLVTNKQQTIESSDLWFIWIFLIEINFKWGYP